VFVCLRLVAADIFVAHAAVAVVWVVVFRLAGFVVSSVFVKRASAFYVRSHASVVSCVDAVCFDLPYLF
jgi:hypothetical protein